MKLIEAKQEIIKEVNKLNGFTTLWEPKQANIISVKLGNITAEQAAKEELTEYIKVCTNIFKSKNL